ncbi:FUSC family protein [Streptomyces resistomycificus]|uniref:FUSC family protein n=1 Tax=Streptomyces resistomycificus TaxID=67356 RepID=UPI001CEE0581|nr:FUSC family protein [Streptomyces resistomycificus]
MACLLVFLVKPDLGPLASRVLSRAVGTVLGALVFAGFAAVLPRPEGLIALVAVSGALIPVATRHFAAQTAVVTVLVLALVMVGGEPQASAGRIGETLLACAIVLIVGHLPMPGQRAGGVRARLTAAANAAHAYLAHVLREADARVVGSAGATGDFGEEAAGNARSDARPVPGPRAVPRSDSRPVPGPRAVPRSDTRPDSRGTPRSDAGSPGDSRARLLGKVRNPGRPAPRSLPHSDTRARRWTLRREAYRTLADARTAISLAAAELPALARHAEGADEVADTLEQLVDMTTACAVHLDDTGRLTPEHAERLVALLDELAGHRERVGLSAPDISLAG